MLGVLTGLGSARVHEAVAQTEKAPPAQVDAEQPSVNVAPAAGDASLSSGQRVERAKALVVGIGASAQSLLRQLQTARKDRDVVRVLCLNDKLNQVDVASRSAEDRLSALEAAAARADADRARHEYTVIQVLEERVRVLVNESTQCVGEETGFVGEAEVSVAIDPNLPDVNPGFGARETPADVPSRSELPWAQYYSVPAPPKISSPVE
jgi:hypothetical protein